jgi:hypothetical protein
MIKEYIVSEIRASQDISPFVFVTLRDPSEKTGGRMNTPFQMAGAGSMEDMMENLSRMFTQTMTGGFTTVLKLTEREYRNMDIKVGDRISLKIDKIELGSVNS